MDQNIPRIFYHDIFLTKIFHNQRIKSPKTVQRSIVRRLFLAQKCRVGFFTCFLMNSSDHLVSCSTSAVAPLQNQDPNFITFNEKLFPEFLILVSYQNSSKSENTKSLVKYLKEGYFQLREHILRQHNFGLFLTHPPT